MLGPRPTGPIPKPTNKKKKKKTNGWKDKPNRYCRYCGKPYAERHEVYCGPNRQISIDNGFQVDACSDHHRELQDNITPWAQKENKRLKQHFQRKWEEKLIETGVTPEQARKLWIGLIGRNYLDD